MQVNFPLFPLVSGLCLDFELLKSIAGEHAQVIDHYGTTPRAGRRVFAIEPYPYHGLSDAVSAISKALGLRYSLEPVAWHFPGACVRVEFWPKEWE